MVKILEFEVVIISRIFKKHLVQNYPENSKKKSQSWRFEFSLNLRKNILGQKFMNKNFSA